jgi:uncharacterized RDD family membrane protein YckC
MSWYFGVEGKPKGPADEMELDRLSRIGEVQWATPLWKVGMTAWRPYGEVFNIESTECHECHALVAKESTIRYGGLDICPRCKSIYFQKVREGLADEDAVHYGGFWIRFAAHMIDGLVISVFTVPLTVINQLVLFKLMPQPGQDLKLEDFSGAWGPIISLQALFVFIALLIALTYETVSVGRFGRTLGKKIFKLRVVRSDFSKVSYARAALRYFGKMLSGSILYIGYIMACADSEKRALHDHMLDTRVIKVDS